MEVIMALAGGLVPTPVALRPVEDVWARAPQLPGESLLARRVDGESLAEEREVEEPAKARVRTDDTEPTARSAQPPPRPMQHGEEIRIRSAALPEIHDEPRPAEAERQVHAADDSRRAP
jgi:hypothetical protein